MRSLFLSLVLGVATLGVIGTPSTAEAHPRGGYHGYNHGANAHWRGGSHYWRGGSHYVYPGVSIYYTPYYGGYDYSSPGYYPYASSPGYYPYVGFGLYGGWNGPYHRRFRHF